MVSLDEVCTKMTKISNGTNQEESSLSFTKTDTLYMTIHGYFINKNCHIKRGDIKILKKKMIDLRLTVHISIVSL